MCADAGHAEKLVDACNVNISIHESELSRCSGALKPCCAPLSQRLVVLVDDNDSVRQLAQSLLQYAGYQVAEAKDGVDALALIEALGGSFDLLVTDCQMPNLDGPGLVRKVRSKYPRIPVVYISGYAASLKAEDMDDLPNATAFLAKPFLPGQFLDLIERLMPKEAPSGNANIASTRS